MYQDRLRQIYEQRARALGGNYLDGAGMCGGNYLDGGKLTKRGVALRKSKAVKKRTTDMRISPAPKRENPWLEYVALERAKVANSKLTYREILMNIDKDAYARWKARNYPGEPKAVLSKAKARAPRSAPAKKAKKVVKVKSPKSAPAKRTISKK